MGATQSSITKLKNIEHDDTAEAERVLLVNSAGTAYDIKN